MKISFLENQVKLLLVVLYLFSSLGLFAVEATIDGIKYSLTSSGQIHTASVQGLSTDNDAIDIHIPSIISYNNTDYKVNAIGSTAFRGNKTINSIILPSGIVSIPSYTFSGCSIERIILQEGIVSLGNNSFQNCYNLEEITLPETITSISSSVFENCTSLTNVTLNYGLQSIGSSAFKGCLKLNSINIPPTVKKIEHSAFQNTGIEYIELPSYITSLANYGVPVRTIGIGENQHETFSLASGEFVCPIVTIQNYDDVIFGSDINKEFEHLCLNVNKVSVESKVIAGGNYYRYYFMENSKIDTLSIGAGVQNLPEEFYLSAFDGKDSWTRGRCIYKKVNVILLDKDIKADACISVNAYVCWAPFTTPEDYQNIIPVADATGASTLIVPKGYARRYQMSKGWNRFSNIIEADVSEFNRAYGNSCIYGDINCDGVVDLADAVLLIDYIQHGTPQDFDITIGDLDKDGVLTVADVTIIINIAKTLE